MPNTKSTNYDNNVLIGIDGGLGASSEHFGFGRNPLTNQSSGPRVIHVTSNPTGLVSAPRGSIALADDGTGPWVNTTGLNVWVATSPPIGTSSYTVGPSGAQFTSIQAAINQARADGHEDTANPAVILIACGPPYVEDITMYRGIYLQGVPSVIEAVVIEGTVTANLSSGGSAANTFTSITGLTIKPAANNDGIIFEGANGQFLFTTEVSVRTQAGTGRAIVLRNTDASSQFISRFVRLEALTGNTAPVLAIESNNLFIALAGGGVIQHLDAGIGAVAVEATLGQFVADGLTLIDGVVHIDVGAGFILNNTLQLASSTTALVVDGSGLLGQINVQSGGAFGIGGTGTIQVAGPVVFLGATGYDPALTLVYNLADLANLMYRDTTAPGTWAVTPVDTQEAINRLATAVSGLLGGPIP